MTHVLLLNILSLHSPMTPFLLDPHQNRALGIGRSSQPPSSSLWLQVQRWAGKFSLAHTQLMENALWPFQWLHKVTQGASQEWPACYPTPTPSFKAASDRAMAARTLGWAPNPGGQAVPRGPWPPHHFSGAGTLFCGLGGWRNSLGLSHRPALVPRQREQQDLSKERQQALCCHTYF